MRIGPEGNPNDKPPTQTAWVDPKTQDWTRETYDKIKESYENTDK
ncbi:hypothetical protein [Leuconostoc gelidum]|nr:hypothetical protein [Leuconostoc gelidum]